MNILLVRKSTKSLGVFIIATLLLVLMFFLLISSITHAGNGKDTQNGRLITIHDRGVKRVILSHAETVGDAIDEAGIIIDNKDAVEPAIDNKLIASDYQVNIYRARPVIIVDGNIRQKIITPYQTAEQIAQGVGIILYPEDEVSMNHSGELTDGAAITMTIDRATPLIFTLYGDTNIVRTQGETVGEMLKEKSITINSDDHLTQDVNTKITKDMMIRLWREGKQTITVDEDVEFDIEKIENADQPISYREIRTVGQKGERSVTYEIIIQDGKEVSRNEIASLITTHPKKQVEVVGVKGQYTTPSENETITWEYLISHGFSRIQATGIMGNLMQEHGFKTSGDGIAQWTDGRKVMLYSRPYPNNIYTQLDFLIYELTTNYASVGNEIKASNNLTEVVLIFQNKYERCGICAESNRIEFARNILASH